MAVRADAHAPTLGHEVDGGEDAVAQVGFGGQAQAGHGMAAGHCADLVGLGVSGMDQAPARVYLDILIEPLQGTATTPGQAIVDFLLLLGDMDVHGARLVAGSQHFGDLLRRDCAQGVEAQTQALGWLGRQVRGEALLQTQVLLAGVDEAALASLGA